MPTEIILAFNSTRALKEYSLSIIGREPVSLVQSGFAITVKYDPALTGAEKTTLQTNLPEWFKKLFDMAVIDN